MAGISVSAVLQKFLPKFDEELLDYITAIVDEMSLDEKRSHSSLHDVMGPFIVDTGNTARCDSCLNDHSFFYSVCWYYCLRFLFCLIVTAAALH